MGESHSTNKYNTRNEANSSFKSKNGNMRDVKKVVAFWVEKVVWINLSL